MAQQAASLNTPEDCGLPHTKLQSMVWTPGQALDPHSAASRGECTRSDSTIEAGPCGSVFFERIPAGNRYSPDLSQGNE